MTRATFLPTDWSETPICKHCGREVRAGDAVIVADRDRAPVVWHKQCPCPSCGKDPSRSEEWSTGQCDDCFVSSHDDLERQD